MTVGFVGLGRLGLTIASALLDSGVRVVGCARGRQAQFTAQGGVIAGDGTARAVAQAADVVFTCLPSESALEDVVVGRHGFLFADEPLPLVVELSTLPLSQKQRLRETLVTHGGDMLDCPIAGSSHSVRAKEAVMFSSGDRATYDRVEDLLALIAPSGLYVGAFGAGMKLKCVAGLLGGVHLAAAAEAMAFAGALGLDQQMVARVLSATTASSGAFKLRAPLMASGAFEGELGTVRLMCKDLELVASLTKDARTPTPLFSMVRELYAVLEAQGHADSDPAKLSALLRETVDALSPGQSLSHSS
jgi:3-hydroxyisobutyrate dehydrogenase